MANPHRGSDFDDWLKEEGLLDEAEAVATKRLLASQVRDAMRERGVSKAALAQRMGTSRAAVDRLLNPDVPSVTLLTIERAAHALGKRVDIRMVNAPKTPPKRAARRPKPASTRKSARA